MAAAINCLPTGSLNSTCISPGLTTSIIRQMAMGRMVRINPVELAVGGERSDFALERVRFAHVFGEAGHHFAQFAAGARVQLHGGDE